MVLCNKPILQKSSKSGYNECAKYKYICITDNKTIEVLVYVSEIGVKKPSCCEFYNEKYCTPCKSPVKYYECDMVKIGNQIKIDKWKPND